MASTDMVSSRIVPTTHDSRRHIAIAPPPAIQESSTPPALEESYLSGTSGNYVEAMYEHWTQDPSSVHASWDVYFSSGSYRKPISLGSSNASNEIPLNSTLATLMGYRGKQVTDPHWAAILSFQVRGHLAAQIDPLGINNLDKQEAIKMILRPRQLNEKDLDTVFQLPEITFIGGNEKSLPLKEIISRLEASYSGSIGAEFMHLQIEDQKNWIRHKLETPGAIKLADRDKRKLLARISRASSFESFLAKKWPSAKRFGLEGVEVLIPALKQIIDKSTKLGVESFVMGMPHRGRLNVLANVCRKPLEQILTQFESLEVPDEGSGDVKYHLGMYIERLNRVTNKNIRMSVVANPSHLEAVNPVVAGKTRAEQFYRGDTEGEKVMSILLHGDAAFAGQGVVYETMHLGELPDYSTKGTIHVVVNNQIGFTTDPRYSRSSPYCTEVGRVVNAPIFHVNADDPEAVMLVCNIAAEWRAVWHKDVIIDLVGYRRHGHNEIDEPMVTQPRMYTIIKKHPNILDKYSDKLMKEGIVTKEDVDSVINEYEEICEKAYKASEKTRIYQKDWLDSPWSGFHQGKDPYKMSETGVHEETLTHIATRFAQGPPNAPDFKIHRSVTRILKARMEMMENRTLDWALAEALAFGSLLKSGTHVRLSGQDVERGTFAHRHHVLHHQTVDGATYNPLSNLYPYQAPYTVCNSSLSELAILGFELGFSMTNPNTLVIWEAQFGDFSNTAQCIIDQFISSGQAKWVRQSGIVMLLPHGMEGMGPEHSSCRPERFLQMCADDPEYFPPLEDEFEIKQLSSINMIVANCSKPANFFHLLRRQICLPFRKPLVVLTPKSLLRLPECRSTFDDIKLGTNFKRMLLDEGPASLNKSAVKKVIFCTGKVYYDLAKCRRDAGLDDKIAIHTLEQICPFPFDMVKTVSEEYSNARLVWCQEEHKNQGAWTYVQSRFQTALGENERKVSYAGREVAPSPSTGSICQYKEELTTFTDAAMAL